MKEIKVVVNGVGNMGANLVRLLMTSKKGVRVVGAIDVNPEKVGKDVGLITGDPLGLIVSDDLAAVCDAEKPDAVVSPTTPTTARETFTQVIPAIEREINIIVPNMGTSNLWSTEPDLAKEVDELCKKHGVSYLGIGATQVQDRFILACTEGCSQVDKITFTHYADIHAFPEASNRHEWGTMLTKEQFYAGLEDGSVLKHDYFADGIEYLCEHMGWKIDDVKFEHVPWINDENIVYACTFKCQGYQKGECKLETNWIFIYDPEEKYYDRVVVEGHPYIDSMNSYAPERGFVTTYAALANAIPTAVSAEPGYQNSLKLPICAIMDDEYTNHL